jgi:hypothetical protein
VSEGDDRRALVAELTADNLTLENGACFEIAPALFRKERLHSASECLCPVDWYRGNPQPCCLGGRRKGQQQQSGGRR